MEDNNDNKKSNRRDFLYISTAAVGAVTVGAATWPLINQMNPSADVAALSSIEVDLNDLEPGSQLTVKWLGKPVFIRRRTEEEISAAREVNLEDLPDKSALLSGKSSKFTSRAAEISSSVRLLMKTGFPSHFTVSCDPGSKSLRSTSIDDNAATSAEGFIWFIKGHVAAPTVTAPTAAVEIYKKSRLLLFLLSLLSSIEFPL